MYRFFIALCKTDLAYANPEGAPFVSFGPALEGAAFTIYDIDSMKSQIPQSQRGMRCATMVVSFENAALSVVYALGGEANLSVEIAAVIRNAIHYSKTQTWLDADSPNLNYRGQKLYEWFEAQREESLDYEWWTCICEAMLTAIWAASVKDKPMPSDHLMEAEFTTAGLYFKTGNVNVIGEIAFCYGKVDFDLEALAAFLPTSVRIIVNRIERDDTVRYTILANPYIANQVADMRMLMGHLAQREHHGITKLREREPNLEGPTSSASTADAKNWCGKPKKFGSPYNGTCISDVVITMAIKRFLSTY